ncbi:DUF3152 domain-containing protein [Nonomuraea pusilla]|uniref:DUF3152 domain-containing protein n=1 Tax=Nonomuraea pusilla TaxID=46177 RepID=UPI0033214AA2
MSRFAVLILIVTAAGCAAAPAAFHRVPAPPPSTPPAGLADAGPAAGSDDAARPDGSSAGAMGEALPLARSPYQASGTYAVVPGRTAPRPGRGPVVRYLVEVERGLPFDARVFATEVHGALNDPRGWARFERVDHGPVRVRVALSSPALTIRECRPLRTGGEMSCWNGRRSIINAMRWAEGVPQYGGDLVAYRNYLISHEVGHGLGHSHRDCPGPGRLAPVMVQQTKSLGGCDPNPWPFPGEAREVS